MTYAFDQFFNENERQLVNGHRMFYHNILKAL